MKNKKKKKSREANYRDVDLTLIVKFSTNLVDYFQLTCSFRRYVLAVLKSQNNPFHMAKFEFCKRFTQSSVSFLWRNFNSKGVKVSYLFTCSWSSHNDGSTVKLDNSQQLSLFLQDSLYQIIEIAVPKQDQCLCLKLWFHFYVMLKHVWCNLLFPDYFLKPLWFYLCYGNSQTCREEQINVDLILTRFLSYVLLIPNRPRLFFIIFDWFILELKKISVL